MKIEYDKKSWEIGYSDGLKGTKESKHRVKDSLAYSSGWIEGEADRKKLHGNIDRNKG